MTVKLNDEAITRTRTQVFMTGDAKNPIGIKISPESGTNDFFLVMNRDAAFKLLTHLTAAIRSLGHAQE